MATLTTAFKFESRTFNIEGVFMSNEMEVQKKWQKVFG